MTTLFSRAVRALVVSVATLAAVQAAAQTADLSVAQTPGANVLRYRTGEPVAVVVTNHGTATTNARVTYTAAGGVPSWTSGTGWFCDNIAGSQVTCVTNNLASGGVSPTLTVFVTATSLGPQRFTSRATVASTAASDPNSANDTAQSVHDVRYETRTSFFSISPSPSGLGRDVTITVNVQTNLGGSVPPANVVIRDGTTVLGTVTLSNGRATFVKSDFTRGTHPLTAEFIGEGNFLGSVSSQFVHKVYYATTTSLAVTENPTVYGTPVRFTATVSSPNGIPSGYVGFYRAGTRVARIALTSGSAFWDSPALTYPSTYEVFAVYEGSTVHAPMRSASITQVIAKATPTLQFTSSHTSVTCDTPVVFKVRLTGVPGSTPGGRVTFRRNGTVVAERGLNNGVAEFDWYAPIGTWQITAEYDGSWDGRYNAVSSSALTLEVTRVPTTTTLTSSPNPSSAGQSVALTAVIAAPGMRALSGTVRFYRNGTHIGSAAIATGYSGYSATYTTSSLPSGSYSFEAVYAGTAYFAPSRSTLDQTVTKNVTTTSLASSANPSFRGDSVTFTASVASRPGVVPTGSVTFKSGATALRTVSLVSGSASYSISTFPLGSHSITATYNGTASFDASTSNTISQAVQRRLDPTITALTALCTSSIGNTASVPAQSGVTYGWSIQGGTITAGAGTNRITFSAPSWGYVTLTANLSCADCASASDTHTIQLGSGVGVGSRDLSGDSLNDLVWQNRSTGATEVWAMNGTTPVSVVGIYSPPAGWLVEGVADVNQDGKADLLYRNQQTGAAMAWLMNNLSYIGSITFAAPSDLAWKLGGIADFNCDGHQDVVWRKTTTGENAVWLMSGNTLLSVVPLPSISTGWTLAGVGDFTTDGRADLVWRRTTDGKTAIWTMNSTTATSTLYPPAQPDLNWSLQAISDYSKDGRPDLVWRNATTGANEIWVMDGITRTSIVPLTPVYDTNRNIGGPR